MIHHLVDHDWTDFRSGIRRARAEPEFLEGGRIVHAEGQARHGDELMNAWDARLDASKGNAVLRRFEVFADSVSGQNSLRSLRQINLVAMRGIKCKRDARVGLVKI